MSGRSHRHALLLEHDRASSTHDGPHRADDLRALLDVMLTAGTSDEAILRNEADLTRQVGIPKARVSSALTVGEERGVFTRRARPVNPRTGGSEAAWPVSPLFPDGHRKLSHF